MKNKRTLLFAGILAAFLMLAVPFAVISFDADDANADDVGMDSGYVAMIDGTGYVSVQDAVDKAKNEDVVRLVADEKVTNQNSSGIKIGKDKKITLDLNGYSITMLDDATTSKNTQLILNEGDLTIIDSSGSNNGRISTQYTGGETYNPEIKNGCATNTITSNPGSVLTIKGGIIENTTTDNTIAFAIDGRTNGTLGNVTVNIEGGYIVSKKITVRIFANSTTDTGSLNISGGTIEGRVWMQSSNNKLNLASLNIEGGTFDTNDYASYVLSSWNNIDKFEVSISGGIFNGEVKEVSKSKFISGGTYSNDVSEFCKDGFDVDITALDNDYALSFGSGKVKFTGVETDQLVVINTNGNLDICAEDSSFGGLLVKGKGGQISIEGLVVNGVKSNDGIKVQNASKVTISNNVIYGADSLDEGDNGYGISLVGCEEISITGNEIYNVPGNSICVQKASYNAATSVMIEGNTLDNWDANNDYLGGRAIRIAGSASDLVEEVTVSGANIFNKNYPGEGDIDLGDLLKASTVAKISFSGNMMNGRTLDDISLDNLEGETVYIDCDTIIGSDVIEGVSNPDKYLRGGITGILHIYSLEIAPGASLDLNGAEVNIRGELTINGDLEFSELSLERKGASVAFAPGVTITGTVNGPDGASITFEGVMAGVGGATLTGGSIIAGGMFTSGSVTINTSGNVLDGTFDDVDITVDDVEVEINDDVVFTNGTSVILNDDASFSKDPVFEAGTKLTIVTGASTEVIQIKETSKVSSSGVVRVGFALPIACENGTVYYEKREVMAITVFEGDSYGQYLAKLGVKADPGYFWNNVFTNEFGTSVSSSSTIHEGDKLVATCYAIPTSSEAEVEETSGFDIADHVVLIEAVIAVLLLIGFVAYIRKN